MKRSMTLRVGILVVGFALLSSLGLAQESSELKLVRGEQYQMRSPEPVVRTAVGDPQLLTVKVINSRELLLTAKANGPTSLMIWKQGYKNPLRYDVNIAPSLAGVSAEAKLQSVQGGMIVSGVVNSLEEHERVVAAAGKEATDLTRSSGPIQVQTDIRIVEISRSELKSIGAATAYTGTGTSIATGSTALLPALANNPVGLLLGATPNTGDAYSILVGHMNKKFSAVMNTLHSNGYAYTLAEPSLVALSGQTASFLAGGEFPYPVSSDNGQIEIEYREFGVRLKLTPTILDDQSIMLKVAPEVSELDFLNGIQTGGVSVPSLRVRRTDTTVQLTSGESFIISGLISSRTASNADKFPGLGDIPILGAFFRSTRFEREDKELIMIVTPHLVRPMAATARLPELPGEVYRQHNPSFGDMLFGDAHPEHSGQQWSSPGVGFAN